MCNAVRENPERAQFVGYNPQAVRFIAFALAGLFAGVAGALAAINFELVNSSAVGAGAVRHRVARRLYRRRRQLHRAGDRRHPGHVARSDAQRRHRRLAALFRPVVHRRGDVRAKRHRRPADDACADVAGARLRTAAAAWAQLFDCAGAGTGNARRSDRHHRDDLPSQRQGVRRCDHLCIPPDARYDERDAVDRGDCAARRRLLAVPPDLADRRRRLARRRPGTPRPRGKADDRARDRTRRRAQEASARRKSFAA